MESLLVKTLNSQYNSTELQCMEKKITLMMLMLNAQLEILLLLKEGDVLFL